VPETALLCSSHLFSRRADTVTETLMSFLIGNQLVLRSDLSPVSRTERKAKLRIADNLPGTRTNGSSMSALVCIATEKTRNRVFGPRPRSVPWHR
jgi:hypothetical protein